VKIELKLKGSYFESELLYDGVPFTRAKMVGLLLEQPTRWNPTGITLVVVETPVEPLCLPETKRYTADQHEIVVTTG
jgi:hypothetical protein